MAATTEAERNEAISWKIQGNVNYKQGNYKEAVLFYQKGLKIDPENIDIWNNKGMALLKLGRVDDARKCQQEIKRLKENSGLTTTHSPTDIPGESEKPSHCSVKIKGVDIHPGVPDNGAEAVTPGVTEKALQGGLRIRQIEENIESIEIGLEKVRLGRIEEARQCKVQIQEMEENIELTKQGLDLVKINRIEEDRKIQFIEENLDLTKKGLELIKLGRMAEAKQYKQQLKAIEDEIGLAKKSLKQVIPGETGMGMAGNPGIKTHAGNTGHAGKLSVPETPGVAEGKSECTHQIQDIEDIIGLPGENDQPVATNKIRLAGIVFIFFVVLILSFFVFFK